jgi:ribokinase
MPPKSIFYSPDILTYTTTHTLPEAVACARLSRPNPHGGPLSPTDITVRMVGAVGSDEFGPRLIHGMKTDGIDTSSIRIVEGQTTGVAVILVEESTGQNRILLNPGANSTLLPSSFLTPPSLGSPLPDLRILQLEIPLETVVQITETAKKSGVDVLLNPAPAVPLPDEVFQGLAHLIVNESEAAILAGRAVEDFEAPDFDWEIITSEFLRKGVKNVIVTLGAKGAFWASAGGENGGKGYVDAEKVERVVDTTAAGDTFVGAYAVRIVEGEWERDMGSVVRGACMAAGRTVESEGAQSAIPWADEVERPRKS